MCAQPSSPVPFAQFQTGHLMVFGTDKHTREAERVAQTAWEVESAIACHDRQPGLQDSDFRQLSSEESMLLARARGVYEAAFQRGVTRWEEARQRWQDVLPEMRTDYTPRNTTALNILQIHHVVGRNALRHIVVETWKNGGRLAGQGGTVPGMSWKLTSADKLAINVFVHLDGVAEKQKELPPAVAGALSSKVDDVLNRLHGMGIQAVVAISRVPERDKPYVSDSRGRRHAEYQYAYRLEVSPGKCE